MSNITDNLYVLVLLGMAGTAILVISFIIIQVRNQNKLLLQKRKLQQAELQYQKELLHAVITSQETERKRIGMDLHDEVGAALSSLRLLIESNISISPGQTPGPDFGSRAKSDIDKVIHSVREIAHDLAPRLDGHFGLYDAIFDLADSINNTGKMEMTVFFDEQDASLSIDNNTALAIYRIIRELVNNTIKHAGATLIELSATIVGNALLLQYKDDGTGLAPHIGPAKKGMGLKNIESRMDMIGASWQLPASPAGSYQVRIHIPLKAQVA
jgi:signal transduction histidine kinase